MKRKLNELLNILMGVSVGVTCATVLTRWQDYQKYPALFEADPSPWWVGILVPLLLGIVAVAVCIVLKVILRRKKEKD